MYLLLFHNDLKQFLELKNINSNINISYSDYEDYQYQTSIALSNKQISTVDLLSFLQTKSYYEKVSITGKGFISVKFVIQNIEHQITKKQKVIIDYCGVNVAKKMHIGHIRSMFIGDYITRLHQYNGDEVIKINHIGDFGNQFGYLINYIISNNLENSLTNQKLTEYYKLANIKNKEDSLFNKQSEEIAYKLQHNLDNNITSIWKKCVDISMEDAKNTFNTLNLKITKEDTQGESFYAPFCENVINDLLHKKIATKTPENTVVIHLENKSTIVLQKSNGNYLYPLYDIVALKWRQENLNPDKIIYVVDKRQSLHFQQIFYIVKKANYITNNVILKHIAFGTILNKDKKPLKTKEGTSLYFDDLLLEGKNILLYNEYFSKIEPEIKSEILNKNIIGGLKFYDLKFNKNQDYIFDWNYVLNFSGGSAPYIQNALVRIDSIFYKLNLDINNNYEFNWNYSWSDKEKEIIFQIQKCSEIIHTIDGEYSSQTLIENIIKTCQLFYSYYETETVINSPQQNEKLQLLKLIYSSITNNIDILGIDYYSCKQKMLSKSKLKI